MHEFSKELMKIDYSIIPLHFIELVLSSMNMTKSYFIDESIIEDNEWRNCIE